MMTATDARSLSPEEIDVARERSCKSVRVVAGAIRALQSESFPP
jgi:hypothetical protein